MGTELSLTHFQPAMAAQRSTTQHSDRGDACRPSGRQWSRPPLLISTLGRINSISFPLAARRLLEAGPLLSLGLLFHTLVARTRAFRNFSNDRRTENARHITGHPRWRTQRCRRPGQHMAMAMAMPSTGSFVLPVEPCRTRRLEVEESDGSNRGYESMVAVMREVRTPPPVPKSSSSEQVWRRMAYHPVSCHICSIWSYSFTSASFGWFVSLCVCVSVVRW